MAQCFISTYRNHYRWHEPEVTPSAKPQDRFAEVIPDEDIWIKPKTNDEELRKDTIDERLRRSFLKRWLTTYRQSYCGDMAAKLTGKPVSTSFENQLVELSKHLYEPESRPKILAPLIGSRKVYGYIRPARNYTPLTNYQFFFGHTAYKILTRKFGKKKEVLETNIKEDAGDDHQNAIKEETKQQKHKPPCDCRCCAKRLKNDVSVVASNVSQCV